MHEFPARLRKHANEDQNSGVKAVALTVFAEAITKYFNEDSKTQRPAAAEQSPVALPPAPSKQAAPDPPEPSQMSAMQHTLLERGDAMLGLGDVSAARGCFVRAAELGIGIAALKVADTYDPAFIAEHNLRGIKADPVEAETWYRKAQSMGEPEAEKRLKNVEGERLLATH